MEDQAGAQSAPTLNIEEVVKDILGTIDREREREIIARRYGLFDRKETLEQIGELLGITRERVRQLEKAVMARLKIAAEEDLPHLKEIEEFLNHHVTDFGNVARVKHLAEKLGHNGSKIAQSKIAFLARLAPGISVVEEDDSHFLSIGLTKYHDDKAIKHHVGEIKKHIKAHGEPAKPEEIVQKYEKFDAKHTQALASVSKNLATLNGVWGLSRWPTVNPKNIRDKIYLILQGKGKPLHFSEIAEAIGKSDFKRKDVTTQAIHNELIKDKRFVLIGRGIYALREWGYSKGTVADVIADVLRKAGEPLHRDEIIKRVLKHRMVKETTILLNLQGKQQFKRVAKATYKLEEEPTIV